MNKKSKKFILRHMLQIDSNYEAICTCGYKGNSLKDLVDHIKEENNKL